MRKGGTAKANREHRAPSFSYSRFKSRIVKRLNSDGIPVASSPMTTGWQHSYTTEYDTVCQKLPLDSPPHSTSQSDSHLGQPESSYLKDLNLLDWSGRGLVALALGNMVAMWNGATQNLQGCLHLNPHTSTCTTFTCSICSVSWSKDGSTLAIGTNDGEIQLWDVEHRSRVRSIQGHLSQVGALSWNQQLLSSGSLLGFLHHHDPRASRALVGGARLQKGVCGLEWSESGHRLASGSTDGLLCIWPSDPGVTGNQRSISTIPHPTAVKALGWCPWQSEVVAVGGGMGDGMLRIWDTNTETCLQSTPTNSQICCLLWSMRRKELLTAHGLPHHHIISWSYPSLTKHTQLQGHTGRVLHMVLSTCESWILSGGSDQQACLWSSHQKEDSTIPEPS
ncbi:cell division cycle protein 20 homolog B-like [Megalops cyprinoides]|uniref:cell division cycle protein 20 homolog B-like n=1 Tax=Megalops cyprinoides TaxID=118141 RepID=UPI0018648091|nr:cell division cycle protein 20 homolog B-like [Megalops cyprinoides]